MAPHLAFRREGKGRAAQEMRRDLGPFQGSAFGCSPRFGDLIKVFAAHSTWRSREFPINCRERSFWISRYFSRLQARDSPAAGATLLSESTNRDRDRSYRGVIRRVSVQVTRLRRGRLHLSHDKSARHKSGGTFLLSSLIFNPYVSAPM